MTVNGEVAVLGATADDERDDIRVDGEALRSERPVYWLVHKPRGVLTTTADPWARRQGRQTVLDLLPPAARQARVFPVGRLDADSEGLVLLTNDGAVTHALLHPSFGNEREYHVTVRGLVGADAIERLRTGLRLEDGPTQPWRVELRSTDEAGRRSHLDVVLREGRKHQIRRAFRALDHPVERLVRVRMGTIELGKLRPGGARTLTRAEIEELRRHVASLRGDGMRKSASRARRQHRKP